MFRRGGLRCWFGLRFRLGRRGRRLHRGRGGRCGILRYGRSGRLRPVKHLHDDRATHRCNDHQNPYMQRLHAFAFLKPLRRTFAKFRSSDKTVKIN